MLKKWLDRVFLKFVQLKSQLLGKKMGNSYFDDNFSAFSQLAGIAIEWECKCRILIEKCDIPVNKIMDTDDGPVIWNRSLDKIIKEFCEAYPHLQFNFDLVRNLRNNLAHSNFYEFVRTLEKYSPDDIRTNAVSMNLNTGKLLHSTEYERKEHLEEMKTFGAFLMGFNVKTHNFGTLIISGAKNFMDELIELKAYSYKYNYYDHAFKVGKLFGDKEFEIFDNFAKGLPTLSKTSGKEFLGRFNKVIKPVE